MSADRTLFKTYIYISNYSQKCQILTNYKTGSPFRRTGICDLHTQVPYIQANISIVIGIMISIFVCTKTSFQNLYLHKQLFTEMFNLNKFLNRLPYFIPIHICVNNFNKIQNRLPSREDWNLWSTDPGSKHLFIRFILSGI